MENGALHIGWRERVDLPEWGIRGLLAKADTGARTSAIDVAEITPLPGGRVKFKVRLRRLPGERFKTIEAPVVKQVAVRSSNGHLAERLFVETNLQIGPVIKPILLGLVCRKNMKCRVLIGREALAEDFLVDPSQTHLHKDT